MVRNGVQAFFPGEKRRDGAQINKMSFWALRNSLSAGKNMYHEENLHPDSTLKSRTQLLLKSSLLLTKNVSDFLIFQPQRRRWLKVGGGTKKCAQNPGG